VPQVFLSYSWDSDEHREWVKRFATSLRSDGVNAILDRWHAVPGDQLPEFMENAVGNSDYVLTICTERYRKKSDDRTGGVGYEGDIMTSEVFTLGNRIKFIPVLRGATWTDCAPRWLRGSFYIDLRGDPYDEANYRDLLDVLHRRRETAPPIGPESSPASSLPVSENCSARGEIQGHRESDNLIERWLERWSQVTLHPTAAFATIERNETGRAVEFFFLNHLASYLAAFLVCIFYFSVFYNGKLTVSIRRASFIDIGIWAAIGVIYVLAHLFAAVLGAAVSFPVYHWMGSAKRLREHARVLLSMSTLEPIAAASGAAIILAYTDKVRNAGLLVVGGAAALFVGIRLYYSIMGFLGLGATHSLSRRRAIVAYTLGFVPIFFVLSTILAGLQWLVVVAFVSTWD
jgi:TIR domain